VEEALDELLVPGEVWGQDFDGHQAVQDGVVGLVDHTHATPANLLQDAVFAQGLADQVELHSCLLIGPYAVQSQCDVGQPIHLT